MTRFDKPTPPVPWCWSVRGIGRMLALLTVAVTGMVAYFVRSANRSSLPASSRWLQRYCRRSLRAVGVEVLVEGEAPHGAMLAPNHVSYLDILALAAVAPTVFVAKAEVRQWPLFGWFARRSGTRFLKRESKSDLVRVGAELAPVIEDGINLVVFLEGTSTDGREVLPFKPGLLQPAVTAGWPVAPVLLRYEAPAGHDASEEVAWWGTMPLVPHVLRMAGLEWTRVHVRYGEPRPATGERKALAEALRGDVVRMLADSEAESAQVP